MARVQSIKILFIAGMLFIIAIVYLCNCKAKGQKSR
ncbi:hypothetical protein SOV_12230 [Sporomusa ovata DSM 2662]|nr:hypothetical protein SOV_1c05620 [Sporomusa ovata DSM 2662]